MTVPSLLHTRNGGGLSWPMCAMYLLGRGSIRECCRAFIMSYLINIQQSTRTLSIVGISIRSQPLGVRFEFLPTSYHTPSADIIQSMLKTISRKDKIHHTSLNIHPIWLNSIANRSTVAGRSPNWDLTPDYQSVQYYHVGWVPATDRTDYERVGWRYTAILHIIWYDAYPYALLCVLCLSQQAHCV